MEKILIGVEVELPGTRHGDVESSRCTRNARMLPGPIGDNKAREAKFTFEETIERGIVITCICSINPSNNDPVSNAKEMTPILESNNQALPVV